jgi:hypothetical protein
MNLLPRNYYRRLRGTVRHPKYLVFRLACQIMRAGVSVYYFQYKQSTESCMWIRVRDTLLIRVGLMYR